MSNSVYIRIELESDLGNVSYSRKDMDVVGAWSISIGRLLGDAIDSVADHIPESVQGLRFLEGILECKSDIFEAEYDEIAGLVSHHIRKSLDKPKDI